MKRPSRFLIAAVLGWGVPALAGDVTALPEGHVWTRQDLERLYGPSSPSSPAPRPNAPNTPNAEEEEQKRIDAFLERQYARLDAERALELRRLEVNAQAEASRRTEHTSGHLLLAPYGYYGSSYYWGWHRPHSGGEHPVYPRPLPPPRPGLKPAGPGPRPPGWRGERGARPGTPAGPYTRGRSGSS